VRRSSEVRALESRPFFSAVLESDSGAIIGDYTGGSQNLADGAVAEFRFG
jgi:hypothetical protein